MSSSISDSWFRGKFVDPRLDERLESYFNQIEAWHGFPFILNITRDIDRKPLHLSRLFVSPEFAAERIDPGTPETEWPATRSLVQILVDHPRAVILGDPGSGKSTLCNWIAYQFSRLGDNEFKQRLGWLIPIPIVLRDLSLSDAHSWSDMLQQFLARPVANGLDAALVEACLDRGQAIVLFDGLDEVTDPALRQRVTAIIADLERSHPDARIVCTSRIVGYEDAPVYPAANEEKVRTLLNSSRCLPDADADPKMRDHALKGASERVDDFIHKPLYASPLSFSLVDQFITQFLAADVQPPERAASMAKDLIEKLPRENRIGAIARIPNLLNFIIQIYESGGGFPEDRIELYEEIARAYLYVIDRYYNLQSPFNQNQKYAFLEAIGYEMQRLRTASQGDGDILATREAIESWVADEIEKRGLDNPQTRAAEFVTHVAQRSGLLIPRGPDRFAFSHLSIQEFFAARRMANHIKSPKFGREPDELLRVWRRVVTLSEWQEVFLLVFRMLDIDWLDHALDEILGDGWRQRKWPFGYAPLLDLAAAETGSPAVFAGLAWLNPTLAGLTVLQVSIRWPNLQSLTLSGRSITDKAAAEIAKISGLQNLTLSGPSITDKGAAEIAKIRGLKSLTLYDTAITDKAAAEIAKIRGLKNLTLSGPSITDKGAAEIAKISGLQTLTLYDTAITDKGAVEIAKIRGLKSLTLYDTAISDKGAAEIAKISGLKSLDLYNTAITDNCLEAFRDHRSLRNVEGDFLQGPWRAGFPKFATPPS